MELAYFLSCIFFLVLLNPLFAFPNQEDNLNTPSPMAFLQTLTGVRKGDTSRGISQLKKYLTTIGHMNSDHDVQPQSQNNNVFDDNLEQALKSYQTFLRLPVTGTLDPHTLAQLDQPRCGVSDRQHGRQHSHLHMNMSGSSTLGAAHFAFFSGQPKWPINNKVLTYAFPPGTRADVHTAIRAAADEWSKYSPFQFKEISDYNQAAIKISFQVKNHGDGSPFDGAGGILAHAFAPTDGRLHYDGDEAWVNGAVPGKIDLQSVGLHEMGHILGLMHSTDQNAAMWPYIKVGSRKGLNADDIAGIKTLYK